MELIPENSPVSQALWFRNKMLIFNLLKYTIYVLLCYDAYRYFQEDFAASQLIFDNDVTLNKVFETFAITIDVSSWLALLFLFELETSLISRDRLRGLLLWILHGLRMICYVFVLVAYYGYIAKYLMLLNVQPISVDTVCGLAHQSFSFLNALDDYLPLTREICQQIDGDTLLQLAGTQILAEPGNLDEARLMALVDVLYATTWLLVVAILEVDVSLLEKGLLKGWVLRFSEISKAVLYSILLGGAIFWGVKGELLDFWDAFLWLAAFALIDLNLFGISEHEKEAFVT